MNGRAFGTQIKIRGVDRVGHMKIKSSRSTTGIKVKKPHADFPLTPHPSGRWCKKVRGKLYYFGKLDDSQAALDKWLEQKDDLLAGRTPRSNGEGLTLRNLANNFLTAKQSLVDTRELSQRTFDDYHATCERLIEAFGKNRLVVDLASDDFNSLRLRWAKPGDQFPLAMRSIEFGSSSSMRSTPG